MMRHHLAASALLLLCAITQAQNGPADFVRAPSPNGMYPQHDPYLYVHNYDRRAGYNDFIYGQRITLNINSGFESYLLPSAGGGNFANYTGQSITVNVRSPIQGGGARALEVNQFSVDDTVRDSSVIGCTGTDNGFGEGCEYRRDFMSFLNNRFGGTLTLQKVDANSRQIMRVTPTQNYDRFAAAEGRVLIDLSRKLSPAGNVSSVTRYSDRRFSLITADPTLKISLAKAFPSPSFETTLKAGADTQHYSDACPSQAIGTWGLDPNGNAIDPYASDFSGTTARTNAQCLTLASTEGLTPGALIGLWGASMNFEYTRVTRVVDATHIVAPLAHPHEPGELVTWGAGIGWAVSTPRNDYGPGTLTSVQNVQTMTQHAAYPIVRINGSQIEIFTNSAAQGSISELHLNLYQTNTPQTPLTFAPKVTKGVVTALNANSAENSYATAQSWMPGVQVVLPPPRLTVTGCTVEPVITLANSVFYRYVPTLVSGGSGCVGPTITAQEVFPNPIVFYPSTKTYRIEDPRPCSWGEDHYAHCPINGYLVTDPVSSAWKDGDTVEIVPHWNQYLNDQVHITGSPDMVNSASFGPQSSISFSHVQNGEWAVSTSNQTPSTFYFGDASTHWMRSQESSKALFATEMAPGWMRLGGQLRNVIHLAVPPVLGQAQYFGGSLFEVSCEVAGQDGDGQAPPCARGIFPDYDILQHNAGHNRITVGISDNRNCLTFNGICVGGATVPYLTGLTAPIGGSAMASGTCISGTANVPGAHIGQPVIASPAVGGIEAPMTVISAGVTAPNAVTVRECALVTLTPAASTFNVRVLP